MNASDQWLIWSIEHNGWWRTGGWGYTPDVNEAGRYAFGDACEICRNANSHLTNSPNETMVRVVDAPIATTVGNP